MEEVRAGVGDTPESRRATRHDDRRWRAAVGASRRASAPPNLLSSCAVEMRRRGCAEWQFNKAVVHSLATYAHRETQKPRHTTTHRAPTNLHVNRHDNSLSQQQRVRRCCSNSLSLSLSPARPFRAPPLRRAAVVPVDPAAALHHRIHLLGHILRLQQTEGTHTHTHSARSHRQKKSARETRGGRYGRGRDCWRSVRARTE